MTIAEFYYENQLSLEYLKARVEANSFFITPTFRKARVASEYGNSIYHIFLASKKAQHFVLNEDMINVIASRFSVGFYPELTHQTCIQYNTYHSTLYSRIEQCLSTCGCITQICDVGCGIAHLAMIPSLLQNAEKYIGLDTNQDILDTNAIINVNECIFQPNVLFVCQSFNHIEENENAVYLLLNTVRYFDNENFNRLISFFVDERMRMIIYDSSEVISNIIESFPSTYLDFYSDSTSIEANFQGLK